MFVNSNNSARPGGPAAANSKAKNGPKNAASGGKGKKQPTSNGTVSASTKTFQFNNNSVNIEVTTTDPEELKNWLYKTKCSKIERKLKEMVFLNAALESEVRETNGKMAEASEDRKFLLNRLLSYQKDVHGSDATSQILQQALCKKSAKSEKAANNLFPSPTPNPPAPKKRKRATSEALSTASSAITSLSLPSTSPLPSGSSPASTTTSKPKSLDPAPKGLSQLLVNCNSGVSSSFLLDPPPRSTAS